MYEILNDTSNVDVDDEFKVHTVTSLEINDEADINNNEDKAISIYELFNSYRDKDKSEIKTVVTEDKTEESGGNFEQDSDNFLLQNIKPEVSENINLTNDDIESLVAKWDAQDNKGTNAE